MVHLWLPSVVTRTMIFGFIRSKTMAREHGKSERILDALLVVKLLPTLKHVINV